MHGYPINPNYNIQSSMNLLYKPQDLQPYKNKQFLIRTFNAKHDYIQAFQALSHQTKLKFYLLLQEVRICGSMSDKEGYQIILNQIANAVKILKGYSITKSQNKQQSMEDKINQLCQYQLKKLENYGNNPSENNNNQHQQSFDQYKFAESKQQNKNTEEIWEWAQNEEEEKANQEEKKQEENPQNDAMKIPTFDELYPTERPQKKLFQEPIIVKFAFTENQGHQQAYKMSVFDIVLDEDDKKLSNQPPLNTLNFNSNKKQEQEQEQEQEFQDFVSESSNLKVQNSEINLQQIYKNQLKNNNYILETIPLQSSQTINQYSNHEPILFQQLNEPYTFQINDLQMLSSQSLPQNNQNIPTSYQPDDILIQFDNNHNKKIENESNQQENTQLNSIIANQKKRLSQIIQNLGKKQSQIDGYMSVSVPNYHQQSDNNHKLNESVSINTNQIRNEEQVEDGEISLMSVRIKQREIQHPLLEYLISNFNVSPIKNKIKHNSFEYDQQFYQIILRWLQSLQYQSSQAYQHIHQQIKIIQRIKQLTEMYTKAVEQDQEEKVQHALKQTKKLYALISPDKNKKIVQFYLRQGNKTILYQYAVFIMNYGTSMQHIQKILPKNHTYNKNILASSLTLLYTLQITDAVNVLPIYANQLSNYIQQQYQKYRNVLEQIKLMTNQQQIQTEQSQKFIQYITGLGTIGLICKRMISIVKVYSKGPNNIVKVLKISKEVQDKAIEYLHKKNKQLPNLWQILENQAIIPQFYTNIILNLLNKYAESEYIQGKFQEYLRNRPLCRFCLGSQSVKRYNMNKNTINIHTECWNLYKKLKP